MCQEAFGLNDGLTQMCNMCVDPERSVRPLIFRGNLTLLVRLYHFELTLVDIQPDEKSKMNERLLQMKTGLGSGLGAPIC